MPSVRSAVSLSLCGSLLAGGTLAYFTKTVENKGNSIRTKSLDVAIEGDIDEEGKIFNNTVIEEGKAIRKAIIIRNTGELDFDYELNIEGDVGDNEELAKDIQVKLYSYPDEELLSTSLYDLLNRDTPVWENALGGAEPNEHHGDHHFIMELLLPEGEYEADTHSGKTFSDITISVVANER